MKKLTIKSFLAKEDKIAIIGLGYVGLPLAAHLSRHFSVIGYDNNPANIAEFKKGHDRTMELTDEELKKSYIHFTSDPAVFSLSLFLLRLTMFIYPI